MRYADIIVPQGGNNDVAIDLLTKFILQNLSK
jgi:uridine kinase